MSLNAATIILFLLSLSPEMCWTITMAEFVDELLDPVTYDKRVRPAIDSGKPVTVYLDMFVNSIGSVDEVKMEYVISIFMRQRWIDERLNYTEYDEDITLNYNMFDRLWVPDLFVKNEKNGRFHEITVPNRLLKLSPNGQIYYSQRLSLTLGCDMHLKYYPMDQQTCQIELESYGYTTRDIVFVWNPLKDPVQVADWLEMPEFILTNVSVGDCTTEYITGSFTCKYATFYLKRQFQYYLIQTFVPSCLIVSLSWVSFWIDIHAVPARVTLGLLTVLTMTTQSSSISSRLPRVSYIKAIDVWMTCCLVFVFGALIEYSIVNVLARKDEVKPSQTKEVTTGKTCGDVDDDEDWAKKRNLETYSTQGCTSKQEAGSNSRPMACNGMQTNRVRDQAISRDLMNTIYGIETEKQASFCQAFLRRIKKSPALGVDIVSRVAFPTIFLIFNIIYWLTYKVDVVVSSYV